jgi:chloride channel protein, CIC family
MPEDRSDTAREPTTILSGPDHPHSATAQGGMPPRSPAADISGDAEEGRRIGLPYLSLLAFLVGIVAGFGAVVFRDLIGLVHNLLFLGEFAVRYDANIFTPPSPWGPFVILVPVVGAIGVTFLVTKFAPKQKGTACPKSWMRFITTAA